MGITTISGQSVKRAEIASAMCKLARKDIPIHSGSADPILIDILQKEPPQYETFKAWPHDSGFPENTAIDFMRKTIRENTGEFSKENVRVEICDSKKSGFTYWHPAETGKHEVALSVNADKYLDHFFKVIDNQ